MLGALVRKRFGGNENTNTGGITVTSDKQDPKKPYEVSPKHEGCWLVILSMRVKITISSMCLNLRFAPQRLNQVGNPSPESNPFRLVMWLVGLDGWIGLVFTCLSTCVVFLRKVDLFCLLSTGNTGYFLQFASYKVCLTWLWCCLMRKNICLHALVTP